MTRHTLTLCSMKGVIHLVPISPLFLCFPTFPEFYCKIFKTIKINQFLVYFPILYPLKTQGNLWFSVVLRRYKMGTMARNRLRVILVKDRLKNQRYFSLASLSRWQNNAYIPSGRNRVLLFCNDMVYLIHLTPGKLPFRPKNKQINKKTLELSKKKQKKKTNNYKFQQLPENIENH